MKVRMDKGGSPISPNDDKEFEDNSNEFVYDDYYYDESGNNSVKKSLKKIDDSDDLERA